MLMSSLLFRCRLLIDAPGSGAVKEEALSRLMQGVNDTAEGLPAVRVLSFHALQVLRAAEVGTTGLASPIRSYRVFIITPHRTLLGTPGGESKYSKY